MKRSLLTLLLLACGALVQADGSAPADAPCPRCAAILEEIHGRLVARCDSAAPSAEQLRREPIYLFLSIYDQVSQGVNATMRRQVYQAALGGMECGDLGAGIEAAKRVATRLQRGS